MLFNQELLFLHVPKTAGTSVTSFLIRVLDGPVMLTEPADHLGPSVHVSAATRIKLGLRRLRRRVGLLRRTKLTVIAGTRHETLAEALPVLERFGRHLEDFRVVLAVIRNPYDLEVSRFHFFRRGHLGVKGLAQEYAEELALTRDFATFARRAPYHGRLPGRIEDWFEIEGRVPDNMHILRFETLHTELAALLGPFARTPPTLPRLNASEHGPYKDYLTPEIEEAIYLKYRWPFDKGYYPRIRN